MRTLKVWPLVTACVAAYTLSSGAFAQQQSKLAPPPPQMEKLEEGEEPTVTIRKPDQQSNISEERAPGGKATEVKVTKDKSTYYLKPNDSPGSALPGDGQSSHQRGAQWRVLEFDERRTPEAKEAAEAATAGVPPPPEKK